jgi:STE24 endopeptidase
VRRAYGLSTRTWPGWLAEVGKGRAGRRGAERAGAAGAGAARPAGAPDLVGLGGGGDRRAGRRRAFAYPVVVEPVFADFTALPAGQLREDLLRAGRARRGARRRGAGRGRLARTTALNAYVSGFGSSRRIVVYDTLLRDATPEQVGWSSRTSSGTPRRATC